VSSAMTHNSVISYDTIRFLKVIFEQYHVIYDLILFINDIIIVMDDTKMCHMDKRRNDT